MMATNVAERISALKQERAELVDRLAADDFDGSVAEVQKDLAHKDELISALSAASEADLTAESSAGSAEEAAEAPSAMSDEMAEAMDELHGRLARDYINRGLRQRVEDEGKPTEEDLLAKLAQDANHPDVPFSEHSGKRAVSINVGAAHRFQRLMNAGGTAKDLLAQLAYTTTTGTGSGNIGDTIPTLLATEFQQMDLAIRGVRRIPGIRIEVTPSAAQMDWPLFHEPDIPSTVAASVATEDTAPGSTQRAEGHATKISTTPIEFIAWCELTQTALAKSAVSLLPAVTRGLSRAGARITERAYASGGSGLAGLFVSANATGFTAQNFQASASGGRASAQEILALPGRLADFEGPGEPVYIGGRQNWYNWIRTLHQDDIGYVFADNNQGLGGELGTPGEKILDGHSLFFNTWAPQGTGASDYYLILFYPGSYLIHDYGVIDISRDDSIGFLRRTATFLLTRWTDSVKVQPDAFVSVQGKA